MGTAAATGLVFRGRRIHPAALLVALCLHALVIGLLTQTSRVVPRPVTVTLSLAGPPVALQGGAAPPPPAIQPPARPQLLPATNAPPPVLKAVPPTTAPVPPPPAVEPTTPSPTQQPSPEPLLTTPTETAPPAPPPTPTEARPPTVALPVPPLPPVPRIAPSHPPVMMRTVPQPRRSELQAPPRISSRPSSMPAAPSPAVPRGGAPSSAASRMIAPSWEGALSAWIEAHKFYPELAQQRGEQGTVTVRFTVMRDGQVVSVTLVRSSGSSSLDRAAETILRGAQVPPFPAAMSQPQISVTVPVRYILEQ
jgi:periplasmic protein TonB